MIRRLFCTIVLMPLISASLGRAQPLTKPSKMAFNSDGVTLIDDVKVFPITFTVIPKVYPERFRCHGTMQLAEDGNATKRVIEGELKIKVPLFASRAEGLILPGVRTRMNREAELLDEWLKDHRAG